MQDNNTNIDLYTSTAQADSMPKPILNYSYLLENYGLKYENVGLYWQVGEISDIQGWIIHLSVIHLQIEKLLHVLIPVLVSENIPFKIVQNTDWARELLYGTLGYNEMGKLIHIYSDNSEKALRLVEKILKLTASFRGTDIPTDISLGGIVYTRYARFIPIIKLDANGVEQEHLYSSSGELVKDAYSIPFQLPSGIDWPFGGLTSPIPPLPSKVIRGKYKPLLLLKTDTRGNVLKGLYLKSLLRVGHCVIKIGKQNMLVDNVGRDIRDRLLWQQDLQQKLEGIIPVPKIIDLFQEKEDIYLVMEFIKGKSLHNRIIEINTGYKSFFQLSIQNKSELLDYLFQVIDIIQKLHERGYIHRDIVPGNFLIDQKNRVFIIDMELTYQLREGKSDPPFELGTQGFTSPEQLAVSVPTIKEDIYGLGALMIVFFASLSPVKFDTSDNDKLANNLSSIIGHGEIANLITRCLSYEPNLRPELSFIRERLEQYQQGWVSKTAPLRYPSIANSKTYTPSLFEIINGAIEGLLHKPMPISKERWMSKTLITDNPTGILQKQYSAYAGLHTGMGGVLYLLSRAKKMGLDITKTKRICEGSWEFIEKNYLLNTLNIEPGLYRGKAGVALALAKGIESGMLENNDVRRQQIRICLDQPNETLGLAYGISGQGIALLQCIDYLDKETIKLLSTQFLNTILEAQQKDGSWLNASLNSFNANGTSLGLAFGMSGVILFLLAYQARYPDSEVRKSIIKALRHLLKKTHNGKEFFNPKAYNKLIRKTGEAGDERTGFMLACIRAYEILQDPIYKQAVEEILKRYPEFVVNNNFSQDGGLAGLGELYCEAWKVFKNNNWKNRSDWIAQVFSHTFYTGKNGGYYWLMEESDKPTADLMTGNSGIIHFLLRCEYPDEMGYILIN